TLAAAAAGFLRYNWPPARIFMGDVGSGFCGFILAAAALSCAAASATPVVWWLIPLAPFICDATTTLAVRTLRGKTPGVAHRSHAYQHLARRLNAHLPVSLAYTAVSALYAGPLFWWASLAPATRAMPAFLACMLPLCAIAVLLRAGRDD
ncbi:MAG TPA: glycosyl transferase, partial [Bordetella sp.]|nr:glycosyl transferase [Bordetella sp.]